LRNRLEISGCFTTLINEVEAKKKGAKLIKPLKLLPKGKEEIKLLDEAPAQKPPKDAGSKPQQGPNPPVDKRSPLDTSVVSSHSSQQSRASQAEEAKCNDLLDQALAFRKKNKYEPISDTDAKKMKLPVPKPIKLKISGPENTDLLPKT